MKKENFLFLFFIIISILAFVHFESASALEIETSGLVAELSIGGSDPDIVAMSIDSKKYTAELISATDTDATIKITNDTGSETKLLEEKDFETIRGLVVFLYSADESIDVLSATLIIYSENYCDSVMGCLSYGNEEDCNNDICDVGAYSVNINEPNIDCDSKEYLCGCEWNETENECRPFWEAYVFVEKIDKDGDGYSPPEDCNDSNENIHPEAVEICDGLDNDCDEVVDEGSVCDEGKRMEFYSDKEVFLISDRNWRNVLSLAPVTTWSGGSECKKGTGTPENVCVYPTLVYHGETGEICDNEIDDNGNGLIDCCDSYCYEDSHCIEICDDDIDNDCDTEVDCEDYDCDYDSACRENICDDGIDNDNDGKTDCEDYDCDYDSACREYCNDGIDNDNDGKTDCDDDDCEWDSYCYEVYLYEIPTKETIQITDDSYYQRAPSIYGDKIVWTQVDESWNYNIFMYDLSTGETTQITDDSYYKLEVLIYGDKIVWTQIDRGDWNYNIYMYNLSTEEKGDWNYNIYMYNLSTEETTQITDDSYLVERISIYGDKIVWTQIDESWNYNIFMHDLSTQETTQITDDDYDQFEASIYRDRIAWLQYDYDNYMYNIFMHDLSTQETTQITDDSYYKSEVLIYGDKIIWRQPDERWNYNIFMYNLSTEETTQITDDSYYKRSISVYRDRIAWIQEDKNWNYNIFMHDLSTEETTQITDDDRYQREPSIYGDKIVWTQSKTPSVDIGPGTKTYSDIPDIGFETYHPTFESINGKNLIRVNTTKKDTTFLLTFDIVSKTRDYIDIIANQREMNRIIGKGYDITVLPLNDFDFPSYAGLTCTPPGCIGKIYHNSTTIRTELENIEKNYPDIAKLYDIGDSVEGRDILAMKISDNVETEEGESQVLVVGNHHAREIMTVEIPLYEINYLVTHYDTDSEIKDMVDEWELWFVPSVNPDGRDYVDSDDISWRKNRRNNGDGTFGVDLNRNYGYTWGHDDIGSSPYPNSESYRGTAEFSEPETQVIRDFVLDHEFEYVLDYHSYGGYILYPWGHIADGTEDDEEFEELSSQMKEFVPDYIAGRIADVMYYSNGDSIDWHYGEQEEKNKIFGFGFEVNTWQDGGFRPPAELIISTSKPHLRLLADLTGYEIEEELETSFDADSIIHFMQQYDTDKITIIGETPEELDNLLIAEPGLGVGLDEDKIQRIFPEDYLSYWGSYGNIIYCEEDYKLALLASTYASLINAPLIIEGTDLDEDENFENKNVICINNSILGRVCNENYNLTELQKKYLVETNTDKIILVNPGDFDISSSDVLYPEKSPNSLRNLYGKTSMIAPFLAGAKHELIIGSENPDYNFVDGFIESKLLGLGIDALYLTIIASPDAIDVYDYSYKEPDFRIYADLDDDDEKQSELAVGRIMGITLSDVSSLIARTIFYDEIKPDETGFLMMQRGDPRGNPIYQGVPQAQGCGNYFCKCYFDAECSELFDYKDYFDIYDYCDESTGLSPPAECDARKDEMVEQLYKSTFAMYGDHGGTTQWVNIIYSDELEDLPPLFGYSFACSTCDYNLEKANLFCTNMIRKGAVGYIGAVAPMYGHHFLDEFLNETLNNDNTIGEAFKIGKNKERIGDWEEFDSTSGYLGIYGAHDIMIADPTFNGGNLK